MPGKGQGGGWLISQTKLFEKLKIVDEKTFKDGTSMYKPIIAIYGEKCYAWCKPKHSMFVINTSDMYRGGTSAPTDVQEWQLSQRLGFDVTNIVPYSTTGAFGGATSILLWGKNGLAVVSSQNINRLEGPSSASSSSTNGVIRLVKKTILLGEKTYIDHPRLVVIQAKWLPSTFATHPKTVAVLNSDNYFRFYRVDSVNDKEAMSCGSVSVEPNCTSRIPFVNRSGRFTADVEEESVADFDIGPCLPKSKYYPLFVLREAGCISYVLVRFVGKNTVFFSEAHKIIPTIGYDTEERTATSIIVSKQFPVFAAIGFAGGVITHSLVLPDFDGSISDNGRTDQGQNVEESFIYDSLSLVVKERLDLDFLENSNYLKLVPDPLHSHRYACIHDIGLHTITANFYPEIIKFFETEQEDLSEVAKCTFQLLLRWRLGDEAKPQRDLMALSFSQRKPQRLLCILQDLRGLLFELPEPLYEHPATASSSRVETQNGDGNIRAEAAGTSSLGGSRSENNLFSSHSDVRGVCGNLLKRSDLEPYLCSKEEIPLKELDDYVVHTVEIKIERMGGIEDGMQFLTKMVATMQEKLRKMEELVSALSNIRGDLQNTAESLAERYEECVEQDELHVKRLEAILSRYHHTTPVVTDKEKEWAKILDSVKADIPDLQTLLQILKERMEEMKNADGAEFHSTLTNTQLSQIKEELKNQTESLNELSYSLKQINEHMYYPALMSVRSKSKD